MHILSAIMYLKVADYFDRIHDIKMRGEVAGNQWITCELIRRLSIDVQPPRLEFWYHGYDRSSQLP